MSAENKYTAVAKGLQLTQAQLLKIQLEGDGIEAHLRNEGMSSLLPGEELATGGVTLEVRSEDYERAMELLQLQQEDLRQQPTYLYPARRTWSHLFVGAAVGAAVFILALRWLSEGDAFVLFTAIVVLSAVIGFSRRVYRCAESSCLEKNVQTSDRCVRCGRLIKGVLKSRYDRPDDGFEY